MQEVLKIFKGRRILITGGLGFIGSNLAHRLVGLGANVLLVDSLVPEYGGNLFNIEAIQDRVQVNISDVRDEHSMRYLVQGQDYLFNLAGQTSHMDSMQDPFTDLEINCRAQLSILEACRKHNPGIKIVFASTRQIYGKPDRLPVDETHLLRPVDVNGINKMAGEWYHILYNNVYGLRACALRLTNTYGPRMRIKDARQTFLGVWLRLLVQGQPFEVWGGEQLRDFTYVDDAVEALLLAAARDEVQRRGLQSGRNLGSDPERAGRICWWRSPGRENMPCASSPPTASALTSAITMPTTAASGRRWAGSRASASARVWRGRWSFTAPI